jgi:hypothetical protein
MGGGVGYWGDGALAVWMNGGKVIGNNQFACPLSHFQVEIDLDDSVKRKYSTVPLSFFPLFSWFYPFFRLYYWEKDIIIVLIIFRAKLRYD